MPVQTVQTQIRLIRVYTVAVPSASFAHSLNVRVIITHFLDVRIFRKFAVIKEQPSYVYESQQNLGHVKPV